jgi:hypothetical protein
MAELSQSGTATLADPSKSCNVCGETPASMRLPFAVGRQDSPPQVRQYRFLGIGPRRKRFVQRHRWVWHILWLCSRCSGPGSSDRLWNAIQSHAETRRLVQEGYTQTRLGPEFEGREGDITFTEEPV